MSPTSSAQTLEARGAAVTKASIEFTDKRWAERFEKIPMRFPMHLRSSGMLPAEIRQATGEIRIPAGGARLATTTSS